MKVLVACEFSGVVRDAFTKYGHEAWSCDLLPTEAPGNHIQDDVLKILPAGWDLMIAHPPCTHLAVSGAKFFKEKQADGRQQQAIDFFMALINAPIPKICVENPIGIMSTKFRKPDQIIQPWQYGHETTKATCLWLKGLPKLVPTNVVGKGERKHYASGKSSPMWHAKTGGGCGKERSITFQGWADAMAEQWGKI
jgi:site-specific DNA-cytosine methylase